MITVEKRKTETTIELFTCDACGQTTSFSRPLAQHIVARHLPHLDEARATCDRVGIRRIVWCATAEAHDVLCEADRPSGNVRPPFTGAGWYAVEAKREWDGEDETDVVRVAPLMALAREAEEHAAQAMADAMTFRRLAEAPVTAPMNPPTTPESRGTP